MRRILFAIATVFVAAAIGIGIAVGTSSGSSVPAVVEHAIAKTLAVKSVEIFPRFPGSSSTDTGPALYQAPDRFESATSTGPKGSVPVRSVVIGDAVYYVAIGRGSQTVDHLRQPVARLHSLNGLTPAQQNAFPVLIDAQRGTDYRRVRGGWTFVFRYTNRNVMVTGGTVLIAKGRVVEAALAETELGRRVPTSSRYESFNEAPPITIPEVARRAVASH